MQDGSNRLDGNEIKTIKDMHREIPVILVITQAIGGDRTKLFINEIEKMLDGNSIEIIPVMATAKKETSGEGMIDIASYGLEELREESYRLLPKAQAQISASMQRINRERERELKIREQKIERANKLAYTYAAAVAAASYQPLPIADAPIMSAIQVAMMASITKVFGVPFSDLDFKAILSGLGGPIAAAFVGRTFVSLLKIFPIFGTVIAGTINAGTGAAITLLIGKVYIGVLSSLVKDSGNGRIDAKK